MVGVGIGAESHEGLVCFGIAWGLARSLPGAFRGRIVCGLGAVLLFCAFAFDLYVTGYGRVPTGNLWAVF